MKPHRSPFSLFALGHHYYENTLEMFCEGALDEGALNESYRLVEIGNEAFFWSTLDDNPEPGLGILEGTTENRSCAAALVRIGQGGAVIEYLTNGSGSPIVTCHFHFAPNWAPPVPEQQIDSITADVMPWLLLPLKTRHSHRPNFLSNKIERFLAQ